MLRRRDKFAVDFLAAIIEKQPQIEKGNALIIADFALRFDLNPRVFIIEEDEDTMEILFCLLKMFKNYNTFCAALIMDFICLDEFDEDDIKEAIKNNNTAPFVYLYERNLGNYVFHTMCIQFMKFRGSDTDAYFIDNLIRQIPAVKKHAIYTAINTILENPLGVSKYFFEYIAKETSQKTCKIDIRKVYKEEAYYYHHEWYGKVGKRYMRFLRRHNDTKTLNEFICMLLKTSSYCFAYYLIKVEKLSIENNKVYLPKRDEKYNSGYLPKNTKLSWLFKRKNRS